MADSDVESVTDYAAVVVAAAVDSARAIARNHHRRGQPHNRDGSASTSSDAASIEPVSSQKKTVHLPQLAPRYLDTSVKDDAQRKMSQQRREAAAVKGRIQRMFRELDAVDRTIAKRESDRTAVVNTRPDGPVSKKAKRRHAEELVRHRELTAYKPVRYNGPASKSPSPVHRLIYGEPRVALAMPRAATSMQ
jgi:hypothetical protein